MRRQQEHLAGADRHIVDAAGIVNFQDHVAAQLIEELLAGVVVEIDPLVRSANDLHDHAGILENQFVADRRFQEMAVCVDPIHLAKLKGRCRASIVIAACLPVPT